MVDILEVSGANKPKPGLAATPASTVSAAQIAAPGAEMGQALRGLGEALGTLGDKVDLASVPAAQAAGLAAVGRDEQGNPTVELKPFALSKSDQAFNAAATQGLMSRWSQDVRNGILPIAQQHPSDPAAFQAAVKAYIGGVGKSAGELRPQIREMAEQVAQQHFLRISNAAVERNTANAKTSILVDIEATTRDVIALASKGGTATPEFTQSSEKLAGLYSSLKGNPLFNIAPARADADLRAVLEQASGVAIGSEAVRQADAQGVQAAQSWLNDTVSRGGKWSPGQRASFLETGRAALKAWQGENKAQIAANKATADALVKQMDAGADVAQGEVDQTIETATRYGDLETVATLMVKKQTAGYQKMMRGLSDEERVMQATGGGIGNEQARIYGRLLQGGLTPIMAFGLMGNLSMESSNNPMARNRGDGRDGTDSIGIAQWNSDRARALGAFAALRGKPVTDLDVQADFIIHELNTTEGRARAAMATATTPAEAARAAIGYFRPAGFSWANPDGAHNSGKRIEQARILAGTLGGMDPQAAMAAGGAPFTPQQIAANPYLVPAWIKSKVSGDKDAIDSAKYVLSAASNAIDKGNLPDAQTLAGAIQIADQNPDKLGRERDELLAKIRGIDQAEDANRSGGTAGAMLVQEAMQRAQGAPIFVQMQAEATKAAVERGAKNLKEQPWNEAVRRGWAKVEPPPLDLSSQGSLNAGFAQRAEIAGAITARSGVGQSALSPGDVAQVSHIWNYGTADQKSSILAAISQLPDQMIEPTLRSLGEDKQSGELAFVAGLHRESPVAALAVIRGQQALLANPKFAPKPEEWRSDAMEKSLPLSIAAPERAGIRQYIGAAVKSVYAGLSARDGDESGSLSQARLDEATGIVTGGLVEHNGSKLIPPARGMTQDQFDKVLWSLSDSDFSAAATKSGLRVTAQDVRRNFVLRGVADGRYALQARNSPAEWLYQPPVLGRDIDNTAGGYQGEQRFILDLKGREGSTVNPSIFGLGFVPLGGG